MYSSSSSGLSFQLARTDETGELVLHCESDSCVVGLFYSLDDDDIQAMGHPNYAQVNLTTEELTSFFVTPLGEFASICPLMAVDGVEECPADILLSFLSAIPGIPISPPASQALLRQSPTAGLEVAIGFPDVAPVDNPQGRMQQTRQVLADKRPPRIQ